MINKWCTKKFNVLLVAILLCHAEANSFSWNNIINLPQKIYYGFFGLFSSLKSQQISEDQKLPIVFHRNYDISFFGVEKIHPFDSQKYGKVVDYLVKALNISAQHFRQPKAEVSQQDLEKIHTKEYLHSLGNSYTLARITEIYPLSFVPNFLLQRNLLKPMRYATQGTIDAAKLALEKGVGINLGAVLDDDNIILLIQPI
jgi:histone deacetylase 11